MNNWNPDIYKKAWEFATIKHSGQSYGGAEKDTRIDYLNHIGSVTMEIIWCLGKTKKIYNAELAIQVALLHDTLEDTQTTEIEILNNFGAEVLCGVNALTKNINITDKQKQMLDSIERIKKLSPEIEMVKVADRITNLYHPPYYWNDEKIMYYLNEAKIIYNTLTSADDLLRERLKQKIEYYPNFLRT